MVAHPHPLIEAVENCISLWFACIAGSLTAHVLCSIDLFSMQYGLETGCVLEHQQFWPPGR